MSTTPDERKAIALYAILDRDFVDFHDMILEISDGALKILYLMLSTPRKEHDENTKEINSAGAEVVEAELKRRKIERPQISRPA